MGGIHAPILYPNNINFAFELLFSGIYLVSLHLVLILHYYEISWLLAPS